MSASSCSIHVCPPVTSLQGSVVAALLCLSWWEKLCLCLYKRLVKVFVDRYRVSLTVEISRVHMDIAYRSVCHHIYEAAATGYNAIVSAAVVSTALLMLQVIGMQVCTVGLIV